MNGSVDEVARGIAALVMDVDGVLTDGRVFLGPAEEEWKAFDIKDGLGLALLRRSGIKLALLTGRASEATRRRAAELKVDDLAEGIIDKAAAFRELSERLGVEPHQIAYVGDDVVDLPALRQAGLAVAVADAVPEVRGAAHWVTDAPGGRGAIREVAERLLKAKGLWSGLVAEWMKETTQ